MSNSDLQTGPLTIAALAGRAVAIIGTGVEGEAAWRFLRRRLPDLQLTLYTEAEALPEWCGELDGARERIVQGPLRATALAGHDLLLRSPGVSPYREVFDAARAAGVRITTPSSLWFGENPEARTVCVTGTKGKSTTTALIRLLLTAVGVRAEAAGNIGRPLLACEPAQADWWVVELSSYQLCDLDARPSRAVLLNLSDEHLDWHRGRENYEGDKLRLARLAGEKPCIANFRDERLRAALEGVRDLRWFDHPAAFRATPDGLNFGDRRILGSDLPGLPGRHNRSNLAAALTAAQSIAGLPDELESVVRSFRGLPHRLERLGERGGLLYVNDSLSTTPVATLAALEALRGRPVTVLVGGLDRGVDWGRLGAAFRGARPHALIAMPDSGARVIGQLKDAGVTAPGGMHLTDSLREAVGVAASSTPAGGVVLLSPGAPSFPRFRDFRERGEAFAREAGFRSGPET